MATDEAKVVDAVPPPPAYYKLFSPDATAVDQGGGAPAGSDSAPAAGGAALNVFPLEPPRPPGPGETYAMFGMPYSSEPVTEELLPPEKLVVPPSGEAIDFRVELKGLLNCIMANYGEFMEMLVSSPSHAHERLSVVETLFVNFHTLLNRYRAHQGRHLILERLREQAREADSVTSALKAAMIRCASDQRDAAAFLGGAADSAIIDAKEASGGVPMDVAVEGIEGGEGVAGVQVASGTVGVGKRKAFGVGGGGEDGELRAHEPTSIGGNGR